MLKQTEPANSSPMVFRSLIFFLILMITTSILITQFNVPFGTVNFFEHHGFLFLVCIAFFPRLTLLFSSVVSGGLLWWLSWLFFPRILVATLATFAYFQTNPILVTVSWLIALGGEGIEKRSISRNRVVVKTFGGGSASSAQRKADAIDVDFKKL